MPTPSLEGLAPGQLSRIMELARRHLDMDVAFVAAFQDGKQVYQALEGDPESFGFETGDGPPLETTYCRLMARDEIPNAIPDSLADPPSGTCRPRSTHGSVRTSASRSG